MEKPFPVSLHAGKGRADRRGVERVRPSTGARSANLTKLYMHGLVQLFASRFDEAAATMERAIDLGADQVVDPALLKE